MKSKRLEEQLRENEGELQRIRAKYFPLIASGIISGYNLYLDQFDYSKGSLFLNYLHSELYHNSVHILELFKILNNEGFTEQKPIVNNGLMNRHKILERKADYIVEDDWKKEKMRYFDTFGRELSENELSEEGLKVIGEGLQYDLLLRITNEKELRKIVDLFKRYTSKDMLDEFGRKIFYKNIPVKNKDAIIGAWDIPLLVCTNKLDKKPKKLQDFLAINQFEIQENLNKIPITISTFVKGRTNELETRLESMEIKAKKSKKYTLSVFVEGYLFRKNINPENK